MMLWRGAGAVSHACAHPQAQHSSREALNIRVYLQAEHILGGRWDMSARSADKQARKLRMSVIKKDFLAGHPGEECVIQGSPPPWYTLQGLPRAGMVACSEHAITEDCYICPY